MSSAMVFVLWWWCMFYVLLRHSTCHKRIKCDMNKPLISACRILCSTHNTNNNINEEERDDIWNWCKYTHREIHTETDARWNGRWQTHKWLVYTFAINRVLGIWNHRCDATLPNNNKMFWVILYMAAVNISQVHLKKENSHHVPMNYECSIHSDQ